MAPNSSTPSSSTTSQPPLVNRLQDLPASRDIATPSPSTREPQDVGFAAEPGRRSPSSTWEPDAAKNGAASSGRYRTNSQSTPPTASRAEIGSMIYDERRGEEVPSFSRHTSDRSNSLSASAISNGSATDLPSSSSRGAVAGQSGQLTARDRWLAASTSNAGPSSRPLPTSGGSSRYGGIELSRSSSSASDGSFRRGSNGSAAYSQPAVDPSAPRRLASGVSDRERPPPGAVERYRAALDGRHAEAGPSGSSPSKGYGASTGRSAQASTSTLASPSRAGNLARTTSPPPIAPAQDPTAQAHALKSQEREEREKEVNRVRRRRKLLKAQIAKRSSGGARSSATGSGSSDSRRLSGGTAMSATSTGSGNGRTSSLGTEDDDLLEGDLQDLSSGEEDESDLLSREGDPVRVLNVWKEDAQAGGPSQSPAREPGVRVTPASPSASRSNSRLAQTSPLLSADRSLAADGDQSRATIASTSTLHGSPIDARTDGGRASVTPSIASSLGDDSFYDAEEDGTPESPARLRQKQLEASSAADAGDMAAWQLPGIDLGGDLDAVGVEDDESELHRLMRPRLRQSTGDVDTPSGSVAGDKRDDTEEAQGTGSSATLRQDAQASSTPLRDSLPSVGERSSAFDDLDQNARRRQGPARLSRLPIDDQDAFARAQAIVDSAAGWNSSGVSSPTETAETFLGDRDDDTAGRLPSSASRANFGNNANEYDPSRTLSDSDLSSTLAYIATQDLTSAATDASLSQLTSGGTSIMSDSGSAFSGPNSPGSPMDSSAPNPSRLFFASTPADGAASLPQSTSTNNSSYSRRSAVILPPARPSPTSPLPAPPDGVVPYSSSSRTSTPVAESAQAPVPPTTSTSRLATTELAKGRSRSHSLGQAAQELIPPPSPSDASPVPAVPHVVFANNVSGTSPRSNALSLSGDNNDTLRGRPRGKTIGAVPPHSSVKSGSATRARPRSLLSNELLPFSSPEQSVATLAEINIEPPYRNTLQRPREEASHGKVSATSTSLSSNPSSLGLLGAPSLPTAPSTVADGRSVGAASAEMRDAALDRDRDRERERRAGAAAASAPANAANTGTGNRSRSGSNASLLQQVQHPPKSHASFVIAVAGHRNTGKSTVIKKGLRQFGLSKPNVLSEKVTSHSTVCVVDQEQRTIEVLEIDASVLLNGPGKRFAWPKFLPHIDAVILCYDAGQISSFRGMSELLENFAIERLSIVMLACKSEISPKQVDPYYASDMAGVYNVGLAECTVQSEEGKKRMRDCFSYLVKEVAKARTGRLRKAAAQQAALQIPDTNAGSMAPRSLSGMAEIGHSGRLQEADDYMNTMAPSSSQASVASSSIRDRNNSGASSTMDSIPSGGSSAISYPQVTSALAAGDAGAPVANEARYPLQQQQQPTTQQQAAHWIQRDPQRERNVRKLSDATTSSVDAPSIAGSNSEDDAIVQQSISKAKLGLQSAKAVGGYVTIEELWDKFFFAAVSGNDERFLLMFMVFYRGFARPLDLLIQMRTRFDALSNSERSDGVMIRFSLTRLTTTLSEWVQDYPGDLSAPDTYPVLLSFYARLLQHPSTTHIAATLHPHIEAARHALDPDAVWSKVEDSDKPQSIAADVPPLGQQKMEAAPAQHLGTGALGLRAAAESNSDLSMRLTSSANASSSSLPQPGYLGRTSSGTDAGSVELLRARGYLTDSLSTGVAAGGSRHRSASDATTSSQEVGNGAGGGAPSPMVGSPTGGGTSTPGGGSQPTSPPPVPPVLSDKAAQQQKVALRSLSNALAELDDEAIASELTRLEWALFTAIRPRDLLRHILVARDVRDPAGPVARSIAHFNYISYWVCSVVLIQGKTKARARMLEKFMNVAAILRRENNYNTLHSVLAGLGNASVHRLKQTRELLNGKQIIKTYQSLARLMGSDRSFAAYRLALENSDGRTIPYLGVHLQDILSMSDGNPSKRASDGMIHWRKFILMDEAVMAIVRCQRYERTGARPNLAVEKLIMEAPVMDEETLWQRSLQVEPRSSASQPSKIKKLMQGHAA